jgi:FixJ family two-component response regulator
MQTSVEPTVFVIDDEHCPRAVTVAIVRSLGYRVAEFESAEAFIGNAPAEVPGCVVTDLRMPGMSGIELQSRLRQARFPLPVIVISGYATTSDAVVAMTNGAVTVLEKPLSRRTLCDAIGEALDKDARRRADQLRQNELLTRLSSLSAAERDVMELLIQGKANKCIAQALGISEQKVASRRRQVFDKTQTDSIADLMRLVIDVRGPAALRSQVA